MDNIIGDLQCSDEPPVQVRTGNLRNGSGRSRERPKTAHPFSLRNKVTYIDGNTCRSQTKEDGIEHQQNADELKQLEDRESPFKRRPHKTPDRRRSRPVVVEKLEEVSCYEVIVQGQVLSLMVELKELEDKESPPKRRPCKTPERRCSPPIVVEELEEESCHEVIAQQEQVLSLIDELKEMEDKESPPKRRPCKTPERRCSPPIVVEELEEESCHEVIAQVPEATRQAWWSRHSLRGIKRRFSNSVAPLNMEGPKGGATPISARLKKACSRAAAALAQLLSFRSCRGQLEE